MNNKCIFHTALSSVADPECLSRIDPNFSIPDPGSKRYGFRIRIKELKFRFVNPKKLFPSSLKYDPGCSSRIADAGSGLIFTHPGSWIQWSKRHRIRNMSHFFTSAITYLFRPVLWDPSRLRRTLSWRRSSRRRRTSHMPRPFRFLFLNS